MPAPLLSADSSHAGLDARAAAIVMRTVRNIVNTGRTIVCTIHQPSIDIFEAFDELLLLKRGGECIFNGQLGKDSGRLIDYFSVCCMICITRQAALARQDLSCTYLAHHDLKSVNVVVYCYHRLLVPVSFALVACPHTCSSASTICQLISCCLECLSILPVTCLL